jgi:hypothetical protein
MGVSMWELVQYVAFVRVGRTPKKKNGGDLVQRGNESRLEFIPDGCPNLENGKLNVDIESPPISFSWT